MCVRVIACIFQNIYTTHTHSHTAAHILNCLSVLSARAVAHLHTLAQSRNRANGVKTVATFATVDHAVKYRIRIVCRFPPSQSHRTRKSLQKHRKTSRVACRLDRTLKSIYSPTHSYPYSYATRSRVVNSQTNFRAGQKSITHT